MATAALGGLGRRAGSLALGAGPAQAGTGGASADRSPKRPVEAAASPSAPMRSAGATWYGPGLYGNHTACGQTLRPDTIGVAHRSLPCGTAVKFVYHGRAVVTRVIDRGPYSHGNAWDLTNGARQALGFEGVGPDPLRGRVAVRSRAASAVCSSDYGRSGG